MQTKNVRTQLVPFLHGMYVVLATSATGHGLSKLFYSSAHVLCPDGPHSSFLMYIGKGTLYLCHFNP
jgi:hypothetical protein